MVKQRTKTKIANALVYMVTGSILLAVVTMLVILAVVSWKLLLVFLAVGGLGYLLGWMIEHETVSNAQN